MIRKYFQNAGILAAAEIVLRVRTLIILPFLTKYLGTLNYGVWSQVSIIKTTLTPLIVIGTESAVLRYLPGLAFDKQKRAFAAWIVFLFGTSLFICMPLLIWPEEISVLFFGEGGEFAQFLILATVTIFLNLWINAARYWYQIHNNAKVYGSINIAQATLSTIAVVITLILGLSVYELVILTIIGDAIVVLIAALMILIQIGWWIAPDFSILPTLLKYGLPLLPASFAVWGLNYMDRFFLVQYSTIAEIGIYNAVYSLGYLIIPLLVRPFRAMYPNAAAELYNKGEIQVLQRLFERSAGISLTLAIPAIIGLQILGKPILEIFTTSEFASGAQVMPIVAIGYVFTVLANYYDVELGLVHRQYLSTISILMAVLVNLILNLALIPHYNILGAAIATAVAFLVQFVLSSIFARQSAVISTNYRYPIKIIVASLVMGIGIILMQGIIPVFSAGLVGLGLSVVWGVLIYGLVLFLFGILSREEISLALSLVRSSKN